MKRLRVAAGVVLLVGVVGFLAACAPGANEQLRTAGADGVVAGFWRGLWHGFILPVTFVVSLFRDTVGVYDVHNNGGWYNFGYVIGALALHGGNAANGWRQKRRCPT